MPAFCLLLALATAANARPRSAPPEKPPFKRALVFTGGGFEFISFLGMLDGAAEMGWHPDLIIGMCGGSVAAALIKTYPDPDARKKYIESKDFYDLLKRRFKVRNFSIPFLAFKYLTLPGDRFIPDLFQTPLLDVPLDMTEMLEDARLESVSRVQSPRVVMIAFKLLFSPEEAGRPRSARKLYEEIFFTDPLTARSLNGSSSIIGDGFPASAISDRTAVVSDKTLPQTVRASMAEPYIMRPVKMDDDYYIGGWPDLDPLEIAGTLAEQVLMPYTESEGRLPNKVSKATFGFDMNQRLRQVIRQNAYRWIDVSDSVEASNSFGFEPEVSKTSLALRDGVPDDYETFVARVRAQWQYGRTRALEAFRYPVNDKTHIRNPRSFESNVLTTLGERRTP